MVLQAYIVASRAVVLVIGQQVEASRRGLVRIAPLGGSRLPAASVVCRSR